MKIKHNVRAALFGIAVAVVAAPDAFASSDIVKVVTDPCANVMNAPARAIGYHPAPPSERGLQCPIQEQSSASLDN